MNPTPLPFGQKFVPDEEMSPATKRILGIDDLAMKITKDLWMKGLIGDFAHEEVAAVIKETLKNES